jgi:hypothetical protein
MLGITTATGTSKALGAAKFDDTNERPVLTPQFLCPIMSASKLR